MVIKVKKRENESLNSLIFRFNKRIKQSGILKEARGKRFHSRRVNRAKRRSSALYRLKKGRAIAREKKYGHA